MEQVLHLLGDILVVLNHFPRAGMTGYEFTSGSIRLPAYTNVNCSGSEESFTDCMPSAMTVNLFILNRGCEGLAGVSCSGIHMHESSMCESECT